MTDRHWKAFERRLAKYLGGRRQPVTGERAGADVETDRLVCQAKKGYTIPGYLLGWLDAMSAWRDVNAEGKAACVIWQEKQGKDLEALVVLRLRDFLMVTTALPQVIGAHQVVHISKAEAKRLLETRYWKNEETG